MKSYQTAAGYAIPNGTTASYYYQVKDWLGTAHVTLDAAGAIKNAMDYYPYGKKLPGRNSFSTNQEGYRYQFTGHEFDGETGYQYHGARYYNEELARYMSVDRYAMKFFHQSPYVYAGNMPIIAIDVNGDYSEEVAKGMAERGADNGYTTRVIANPDKEGDFGVVFSKRRSEGLYRKTQFEGKFTGIGKSGLIKDKDAFANNLKARLSSPESQAFAQATQKKYEQQAAAVYSDNVAPSGIQSTGTGRASDGRYYRGCMSCHSQAGAYSDDVAREGWHQAAMASFQLGLFVGGTFLSLPGVAAEATISNPVPGQLARVVPADVGGRTLGAPGAADVFVTAADDIAGLNANQIASRLTIPNSSSGFRIIEFNTPRIGISSPINRTNPGFVGYGRTAGGAREFTLPNQLIPEGSIIRIVK